MREDLRCSDQKKDTWDEMCLGVYFQPFCEGVMATGAQSRPVLRFEEFEVDLRSCELRKRGARLRLQDQPFQVLRMLLENRGEIVGREELKQKLWPADTFVDFDDGLNTAVNKLRDTLAD